MEKIGEITEMIDKKNSSKSIIPNWFSKKCLFFNTPAYFLILEFQQNAAPYLPCPTMFFSFHLVNALSFQTLKSPCHSRR